MARLERQGLGPQEALLASRAVHVVTATVLLDLNVASRAELDKFGVLDRPVLVELVVGLFARPSLLVKETKAELLLAAVRVDAEAVLLGEVAALQGAGVKLSVDLELSESLVEGEAIELVPSDLIDQLLDLFVVDDLSAREVRALDTNDLDQVDHNGDTIAGDNRDLMMESRSAADLDAEVACDARDTEAMTTIQS